MKILRIPDYRYEMSYIFSYCAWLIALIGSFVSIYYGEILMMVPCRLCWYQRIALFPLAVILGISLYRSDRRIFCYAIPFSIFGAFVALYQILASKYSVLQLCGKACIEPVFSLFGWITFPHLSLIGFFLISICIFIQKKLAKE